jgi:serine/threonine protein phosphatase PrpC
LHFEHRDSVLNLQLSLLHPTQGEIVDVRLSAEPEDRLVEIAVLDLQLDDATLYYFLIHVRANHQSEPEKCAAIVCIRRASGPMIDSLKRAFPPRVELQSQRLRCDAHRRSPRAAGPGRDHYQPAQPRGQAADQVISTAENLFGDMSEHDSTFREMLLHLAAEAHTVIRLSAISSEKEPHSTLCALVIRKQQAIWAHAGDSRLYFFRDGRLVHRTEDHTYAQQLREEGRHEDAEIATQRYKNILVSALGINKKPKVETGEDDELGVGDVFLLASDGLWAYFENDELARILSSMSPRDASEELIGLARERAEGHGDNLSLAIVKLEPAAPKRG